MADQNAPLPQSILVTPDWVTQQIPADWLTMSELSRWQSYTSPTRRADWLAGRLALKRLLWQDWNIAPLECALAPDGIAPVSNHHQLSHINVTISHSDGYGAASWSDTAGQGTVGVDVQSIRPVKSGLASRILSCEEAQAWDSTDDHLLLYWALKEAAIKARREPYGQALNLINVSLGDNGAARITMPGEEFAMEAQYVKTDGGWLARVVKLL